MLGRTTTLLMTIAMITLLSEMSAREHVKTFKPYIVEQELFDEEEPSVSSDSDEEKYISHVHSLFDSYRGEVDASERMEVETNELIDTKYRTWKRNADIINSLLALPKGMNEAGR